MKKVLLLFCMIATLVSCGSKNEQWEYKVVKVAGTDAEVMADFGTLVFADQTSMLNKMGKEGWELVSTYTETGTSSQTLAILNMSQGSAQTQEPWW
jgi:hypothetical protein